MRGFYLKSAIAILSLFFLISGVAASSFGVFPYQTQKEATLIETDFEIGVMNLGDQTLRVEVSSEQSQDYQIFFPQKEIQLRPSNLTDNPAGENWYYTNNGNYVKIRKIPFKVRIDQNVSTESISFPLEVQASAIGTSSSGDSSETRLVQVREFQYTLDLNESLKSEETAENDSSNPLDGGRWREVTQPEEYDDGFQTDERIENLSDDSSEEDQEGGINGVTLLLALGTAVSIIYLFKVI